MKFLPTLACFWSFLAVAQPLWIAAQSVSPADTLLARQYLRRAQAQLDSSQPRAALEDARRAETILNALYGPTDGRMAEAYCLAGLSLLKLDPMQAGDYFENKIPGLVPPISPMGQAHIYYFNAQCYQFLELDSLALAEYARALDAYRKQAVFHVNIAGVYCNTGLILKRLRHYDEALERLQQALLLWEKYHGPRHPNVARAYHNMAFVQIDQRRYAEARRNIEKAIDIRLQTLGTGHWETAAAYLVASLAYEGLGQTERAKELAQLALQYAYESGSAAVAVRAYTNIGLALSRQGEPAEARFYFEQALALERDTNVQNKEAATTYFNIATTYKDERRFVEAQAYYDSAWTASTPLNADRPNMLSGLGLVCEERGEFGLAESYFRQSYDLWRNAPDRPNASISIACFNLANLRGRQKQWAEALQWNREAQQWLDYQGPGRYDSVVSLPELNELLVQETRLRLLSADAPGALAEAEAACERAYEAFEYTFNNYEQPSDQILLTGANYALFEENIALYERLFQQTRRPHYRERAFQFAERAKAFTLLEALQATELRQSDCIPDSLLRREKYLLEQLARLDKQYHALPLTAQLHAEPGALAIVEERARYAGQYRDLLQRIDRHRVRCHFPEDLQPVGAREVQETLLEPDQALVEYVVGDDSIFIFVLTQNRYEVSSVPNDFALESRVHQLLGKGIADFSQKRTIGQKMATDSFTEAAILLYDKLLRPVEGLLAGSSRLIVVPDGPLGYLPFEALLPTRPAQVGVWRDYHFLVEKFSVSYDYSATLLRQMRGKSGRRTPEKSLLAIAPFFNGESEAVFQRLDNAPRRDTLGALPNSGPEAAAAAAQWGGFWMREGGLAEFLRAAPEYRILHLATHGKADDRLGDYAWLAFAVPGSPGRFEPLFARDIYDLRLNAELVVLSACQTGTGRLRRGEGIISLARAFARAGARSLLTTLWSVSDSPTQTITTGFHQYLAGQAAPKDKALQQAKLDYLAGSRGSGNLAHPYYWAGFLLVGDARALSR